MAQYLERTAVGKPRDLQKVFDLADQKQTPYLSRAKKGSTVINMLQEWPVDNYPAVSVAGVVSGVDATSDDFQNMHSGEAILQCYGQIRERYPSVDRLSALLPSAGAGARQKMAQAIAKGLVMLKRDIEAVCCGDNDCQLGNGSVPYLTRGQFKWLQNGAQDVLPVAAAYRTPTAQIISDAIDTIDDQTVYNAMKALYDQTGNQNIMLSFYLQSGLKAQLSELLYSVTTTETVVRRFNQNGADRKVTQAIDIIDNDFGKAALILDSFINLSGDPTTAASKRCGFMIPQDKAEISFLENVQEKPMAPRTGGESSQVWATFVNKNLNPLAGIAFTPAAASTV